jgi:hypothetical protein
MTATVLLLAALLALAVLALVANRRDDRRWARRVAAKRAVTPPYVPAPPASFYDEYGRIL